MNSAVQIESALLLCYFTIPSEKCKTQSAIADGQETLDQVWSQPLGFLGGWRVPRGANPQNSTEHHRGRNPSTPSATGEALLTGLSMAPLFKAIALRGVAVADGGQPLLDFLSRSSPILTKRPETGVTIPKLGVHIAEEDDRVLGQGVICHGLKP